MRQFGIPPEMGTWQLVFLLSPSVVSVMPEGGFLQLFSSIFQEAHG